MLDKKEYKAAVYCRVANEPPTALYCRTATQDDFAMEHQKERLLHFANENGYTDTVFYIDNGENGSTLNRPAMERLISDICSGKVTRVIAASADRIARGTKPWCEWVMLRKKFGFGFIMVDIGLDGLHEALDFWPQSLRDIYPEMFKHEKRRGTRHKAIIS